MQPESLQQVFTHVLTGEMLETWLTLAFKLWFTTRAATGTKQALGAKLRQQKCVFPCLLPLRTESGQKQD